ncbi:MAG: sulfatase-like hydrolase/transferase [Cyclobacteriaceae bacterium]|nr:sulfatase-like hydrolase/transferase [Cyclobacteriaceae bacterium]
MWCKLLLIPIAGLSLALSGCNDTARETGRSSDDRPNIILMMVDDLGKEWVSAYGAEDVHTPNIDALTDEGMLFHNVYAMPQCTPTRVTLLTGQYPFRHGWVNHWDVPRWGGGAHFDENMYPPLMQQIKKAGYATCIAGKWQIDDFRVEPDALTRLGFDEYCMWTGYETGVEASAERYDDPYIFTSEGSQTHQGKFGPDIFRDFIINFIKVKKDTPFFVYYPMALTHTPFVNTPDEQADDALGKHKAMVRYTDKITGQIVQALKEAGVRDNTVIIWTADNGTAGQITGRYQGRKVKGGKSKTIEPGINMPFLVSWPLKMKSRVESDALVDFTDILPTCLDLAGVPVEEFTRGYEVDGRSFKNVLLSPTQSGPRKWILSMGGGNNAKLTDQGVENQYVYRDRVLRNKKYKLYINPDRQPEKFYDLLNDPAEESNIIDSLMTGEQKNNFEQLLEVALSFPEHDSDPRYKPNPPQAWDVEVTAESGVWKR